MKRAEQCSKQRGLNGQGMCKCSQYKEDEQYERYKFRNVG